MLCHLLPCVHPTTVGWIVVENATGRFLTKGAKLVSDSNCQLIVSLQEKIGVAAAKLLQEVCSD